MEKHLTFGVAGHVDHGKTSLVRALTGVDTDRLKEEKRRGLSIEAGIAPMLISSDLTVTLVDVPGHTDFLKNTIRGLSAIDAAVLVVAADDGVMPQTREHLEILKFLGITDGLVVLSKADLVDEETLALAQLEIEELLKGTFLEGASVIAFSALDGRGLDKIRAEIKRVAAGLKGKPLEGPFRFWIDQIKSFPGFGTVVSGTVLSGRLRENDVLYLYPKGLETRARSLQVHHRKVGEVVAGQRAGISLHKIHEKDVERGMVLAQNGSLHLSRFFNASLQTVSRPLKDRVKVKIHVGSAVACAMVVLMGRSTMMPGEAGFCQLRLTDDAALCPKDPFLVSPLNEQTIIAGGSILEICREKFRASKAARIIPYLESIYRGDAEGFAEMLIALERDDLIDPLQLVRTTGLEVEHLVSAFQKYTLDGKVIDFGRAGWFSTQRFNALKEKLPSVLADILREDPIKQSASADEIKGRLAPSLDNIPYRVILNRLVEEEVILKDEGGYRLADFSVELSGERKRLIDMLLEYAEESGLVPFSADTFWKVHRREHNKNEVQRLLDYLYNEGKLIRLSNRRYMSPKAMEQIKVRTREVALKKGFVTLGDCKEIMGYGRTVGVPVLEYLDSIGFTRREGDMRTLA